MSSGNVVQGVLYTAMCTFIMTAATVTNCRNGIEKRQRLGVENDFCAKGDKRGGGRLLRGQNGTFVCVDPKAIKWERSD